MEDKSYLFLFLSRNGFSTTGVNESTNYGSIGHEHLHSGQESVSSHGQPNVRSNSHSMAQENQIQPNGGNSMNQQHSLKQTGQTQQSTGSTSETPRVEGS